MKTATVEFSLKCLHISDSELITAQKSAQFPYTQTNLHLMVPLRSQRTPLVFSLTFSDVDKGDMWGFSPCFRALMHQMSDSVGHRRGQETSHALHVYE